MSGEHTFGASDDIVRRIRENLPHIQWEQPLSAERERLAADEIERLRAEIERLQSLLTAHGYHGPDCKLGYCWCDESKEIRYGHS